MLLQQLCSIEGGMEREREREKLINPKIIVILLTYVELTLRW